MNCQGYWLDSIHHVMAFNPDASFLFYPYKTLILANSNCSTCPHDNLMDFLYEVTPGFFLFQQINSTLVYNLGLRYDAKIRLRVQGSVSRMYAYFYK